MEWFLRRAPAFLSALVIVLLSTRAAPGAVDRPPNILLILIDDMSWIDPACQGNPFHETPHIDRLAQQGMRFTDCYASGAVCSPTRAGIQSGQYQARFGITDFIPGHFRPYAPLLVPPVADRLPLEIMTPAELVKQTGYRTAYFGKWHLGSAEYEPDRQGYDVSLVTNGRHFAPRFRTRPERSVPDGTYLADFLTDETIRFIRQHRETPFFVMLSHFAVHLPLEAKAATVEKYRHKPKPAGGVYNPVYAAMVEHVDESLGRLLAALDDLGLTEDTLVIFTSDNGGLHRTASPRADNQIVCSNAPLRGEKGMLYEGGIRVPLICRWPRTIPAGTVCSEPVISIDFWPTIAQVAGIPLPDSHVLDGVSLLPLFKNPEARLNRDALYFHFPHYHHSRPAGAVRQGDWKLLEFFEDGRLELYNIREDLAESENLAERFPERADAMQQRLAAWRMEINAQMPTPNPQHDPARELDIDRSRQPSTD